jgi:hypothetical protein
MRTSKRSFLLAVMAGALLLAWHLPAVAQRPGAGAEAARISVTIYFGKPPDCKGWGVCKITVDTRSAARQMPGKASVEGTAMVRQGREQTLSYTFNAQLPGKEKTLPVEQDMDLDEATAKSLGYKSVTVLKGDYPIDSSMGRFGGVHFRVRATK